MKNTTRTIYGSDIQNHQYIGKPYQPLENTTLNEKLNIQSGVGYADNVYPRVAYVCIGRGGHKSTVGADGIAVFEPEQHFATDAAPYKIMPFLMREVGSDITSAERAKYALRRIETHNSVQYICYYLRRLVIDDVVVGRELRSTVNGVTTVTPFTPSASNLNPVPRVLSNEEANVLAGDSVVCTAKLPFVISGAERNELIHVAEIIYGDSKYALISEVGLCAGVDKTISITEGSTTFNFNEAIGVQITQFINVLYPVYAFDTIDLTMDVGTNEPMFNIV